MMPVLAVAVKNIKSAAKMQMSTVKKTIRSLKISQWAWLVAIFTVGFYQLAFPPFHLPETAYFFAVPFLMWAAINPSPNKPVKFIAFSSAWIAWFLLLIWLRHVTWAGLLVLSGILSLFLSGWLWVASLVIRRMFEASPYRRLVAMLGLAGLWCCFEWVRSVLFGGFPWLPLAASQWERPALLQILAWTGSYGLSFIIIFTNLGITQYWINLYKHLKERRPLECFSCLEFYLSILMLVGLVFIFIKQIPKAENQEFVFTTGVAQPYTPGILKWTPNLFKDNIDTLEKQTFALKALNPDVILWPETALPAILNNWGMQQWVEALVKQARRPLLAGGLIEVERGVHTAMVQVTPENGIHDYFYAKRKLVPFGEYVPFRKWIPFIEKVVPGNYDALPGKHAKPLTMSIKGTDWRIGGLVCYEDIFPHLARATLFEGADLFVMVTNNSWYGEEGGAYQHAAHSVLRAVELRRPLIRCGNGGWSGWIDEYGKSREVAKNQKGSVYFKGIAHFTIYRDKTWVDHLTFYAQKGNWFVYVCLALVGLLWMIVRKEKSNVLPI